MKRVDIFWTLLNHFQANPKNFHNKLVTQDEIWVHHVKPESNIQSKQWKYTGSLFTKKFKLAVFVSKVMASAVEILKA